MTTPVITGPPEHWPLPATRCIFRGHLMDYETAAFIMAMEAELGYQLTVLQGCYTLANESSAGTHGGGGVFDLAPFDWERKCHVGRSLGAQGAWHRPFNWDGHGGIEHIHVVIGSHPTLSGAARQQVVQFNQKPRKNGLANEAVDPDQYPPRPPARITFRYPPKQPATPTFRGVSLNDDWGNRATDVPFIVEDVRPLCMGVQEGWRVKYRKALGKRWGVGQKLENKSTAGVAVIWDRRRLSTIGRSRNTSRLGAGWQAIGRGSDTRVRGVKWRDVKFRPGVDRGGLPARFRLASVHRPPMRNRKSWDGFDAVLSLWLKRSPLPVLLFMDSNEHGGPTPLRRDLPSAYSWHAAGSSIDGAVTSLPVKGVVERPTPTSDHDAAVVMLG